MTTPTSYSLNSLEGDTWGFLQRTTTGVIKGNARSSDNSCHMVVSQNKGTPI